MVGKTDNLSFWLYACGETVAVAALDRGASTSGTADRVEQRDFETLSEMPGNMRQRRLRSPKLKSWLGLIRIFNTGSAEL